MSQKPTQDEQRKQAQYEKRKLFEKIWAENHSDELNDLEEPGEIDKLDEGENQNEEQKENKVPKKVTFEKSQKTKKDHSKPSVSKKTQIADIEGTDFAKMDPKLLKLPIRFDERLYTGIRSTIEDIKNYKKNKLGENEIDEYMRDNLIPYLEKVNEMENYQNDPRPGRLEYNTKMLKFAARVIPVYLTYRDNIKKYWKTVSSSQHTKKITQQSIDE